ncbi:type II toxin-antitoxin system VapC family toxin [Candidatus Bathyarchaeota archaeon]|nr:type II toxin-antitoxin system VapC family toxin [Candidatus Bathyarchaeota archaeon]
MKLLDTCFLVDLLRGDPGAVEAARELKGAATTSVNVYELFFGVYNAAGDSARRAAEAERLVERLEVLPLGEDGAKASARVMAELYRGGEPIDAMDVFTACIGVQRGCSEVLTRNTRYFTRIPGTEPETY